MRQCASLSSLLVFAVLATSTLAPTSVRAAPPEVAPPDDPWAPRSEAPGYPLWPTAIDAIVSPLLDPSEDHERRLLEALAALEGLPHKLAAPALSRNVKAKGIKVRRMAVQQCLDRDLQACVGPATEQLESESDPGLTLMLLSLIARRPATPQLEALTAAAFADGDAARQHAVMLLGQAPLPLDRIEEVERALVAKLGDGVAAVRSEAARSLGLVGAEGSGLALVRLLDDPDPTVRGAAAESLGRLADPRTTNALTRALSRAGSTELASAIVQAVAMIPGEAADAALLGAFDDPPRHLSRKGVVEAIALRVDPSDSLVDGMVRRLRDPTVRDSAVHALLGLGADAAPRLRAASARGLEPALALEVERLLAAVAVATDGESDGDDPPTAAAQHSMSELVGRVHATDGRRADEAAIALGARRIVLSPDQAARYAQATLSNLARAPSATAARPWLLALIGGPPLVETELDPVTWARLLGWAHDDAAPVADRCFSALALATAPARGKLARRTHWALRELASDGDPELRACAAFAAIRRGVTLAAHPAVSRLEARRLRRGVDDLALAGLADDAAHVRAYVALALAGWDAPPPSVWRRLVAVRARDPSPIVQSAAHLALSRPATPRGRRPLVRLDWRDPDPGRHRWTLVDAAGLGANGAPLPIWLPAPGGDAVILGVAPVREGAHIGSNDALPALEGLLEPDTIDISIDSF